MSLTTDKHPKQGFMIERIAFFSDAVFAIAITLLVIEIKAPKIISGDSDHIVWEKFRERLPELFGLLVSFWLIASVWMRHHQLFKYIDKYDKKFIVINLWLLFTIILFPFSTSFLFNSIFEGGVTKLQVFLYLGLPLISNFIVYCMFRLVNRKHLDGVADREFKRAVLSQEGLLTAFSLALIWIAIMPFQYHVIGYAFFGLTPLIIYIKKKLSTK